MNWKVLLAGATFILIVFAAYIGFQFIQNKGRISSQNQSRQQSTFTTIDPNNIPQNVQEAARSEVYSQTVLVRGEVTQYNQTNNIVTLAVETKQLNGTTAVIGLLEISIDPKLIKEFSCWPSAYKTPTGGEISIRNAYMPINSNSILYLKGEVKKPINQVSQFLSNKPFIFALLNSSPTDAQSVLTDTTGLPTQVTKELAILGCTE